MDPLDPLTEIINSGQGFSPTIALERFIWLMIGFFLLGAISTSITREMKQKDWFGNKSFLSSHKATKIKDKLSDKLSDNDK
ncbi:MAG: lectin subunit alpha [Flavobacteriales bacterium]|nr:lectin subunit alpha [Flavobacteriales bacterium]